jgi:hypothetical protein
VARQQHHEAIDADTDSGGRRHPVLERVDEVPIGVRNFFVALAPLPNLRLKTRALIVGVVELGEGVGELEVRAE